MYTCEQVIIIDDNIQEIPILDEESQDIPLLDEEGQEIPIHDDGIQEIPILEDKEADITVTDGYPIIYYGSLTKVIPFTLTDFKQLGTKQKYVLAIPQKDHKLRNPFVKKIIVEKADAEEETPTFMTPVVCGERLLSTGTMKIYVTIDLSVYTAYEGKIYLEGE